MEKKDMALLIEVEDELHNMDKTLEQLAGYGHANGKFIKLDNVFDVIFRNSHEYYTDQSEERMQLFFQTYIFTGTVRLEQYRTGSISHPV